MEIVTEISHRPWLDFLRRVPSANIFQSPEMMRVYGNTDGYSPHVVGAETDGAIVALMASVVISQAKGLSSKLSSRALVVGGPLGDPSLFGKLLTAHDTFVTDRALFTQIRNLVPPQSPQVFESIGYVWEDHLNFLIDLRQREQDLLNGMSKARRKGIARGGQAGLESVPLSAKNSALAYDLIDQTYRRARLPLPPRSLFEAANITLSPSDKLWAFLALHEGVPCAVRFVLRWGPSLYDWYAGSSQTGRSIHADEWLVWQILRRGMSKGCETFDFGGAGRPQEQYGPAEFKRRFGGLQTNPGRFEKAYHPLKLRAAKAAYSLWRKVA